jgi:hypothetical protein
MNDEQAIQADIRAGYSPDQVKARAKARKMGKHPQPARHFGAGELATSALVVIGVLVIVVLGLSLAGVF